MYQIYVNNERLEIKISKISNVFRGTKEEHEASQNPIEIIRYNTFYSFCATRFVLVEYAKSLKEKWLIDAQNTVEKIERISF